MFKATPPIPGYWYSNPAGQLFQVRARLYFKGVFARIIIEDITGYRTSVLPENWKELQFLLHSPIVKDTAQTW